MAMRIALLGLCAVALSACDSGTVPSPADRLNGNGAASEEIDTSLVALHGDGLVSGAEAFYFAAGQTEVEAALSRTLGKPGDSGTMAECGAGPMEFATFPGGLTVNFQSGGLVGWNLSEATDSIQIDADVTLGMSRDDLGQVSGFSPIKDSTLGEEFVIGGGLAGFVEDGAVTMLYAGVQCFFR